MKINELPLEIQNRVLTLQLEAGNLPNADLDLIAKRHEGNFDFHKSSESWHFWAKINGGDFTDFWKTYGYSYPNPCLRFQGKLKDTITDIIRNCPFTMSEHNWETLAEIMSIHLQKMLMS